jgi:hypothetical protein
MTIGPLPMIRMESRSSRRGIEEVGAGAGRRALKQTRARLSMPGATRPTAEARGARRSAEKTKRGREPGACTLRRLDVPEAPWLHSALLRVLRVSAVGRVTPAARQEALVELSVDLQLADPPHEDEARASALPFLSLRMAATSSSGASRTPERSRSASIPAGRPRRPSRRAHALDEAVLAQAAGSLARPQREREPGRDGDSMGTRP